MTYSDEELFRVWLSSIDGVGVKRFAQLMEIFDTAEAVWNHVGCAEMSVIGKKAVEAIIHARTDEYFTRMRRRLENADFRAVTRISEGYPPLLNEIFDPPETLYVRGDCPLDEERMFAIVGSRRVTRDGSRAAREIACTLAQQDVIVVSGLARGTDTAAHEGTLAGGGRTIAVMGCGLDTVYPPENEPLAEQILSQGGAIITEYPPATKPNPGHFPQRNRIISGMTAGTLIVEGAKGSGAMITVNDATEQGREVFAVPGSIYSPLSDMPNHLIQDGAHVVLDGWDIVETLRWGERPERSFVKPQTASLSDEEKQIVLPLTEQALSFEELKRLTGCTPAKLNTQLTLLELKGIVVKEPGGMYRAYLS